MKSSKWSSAISTDYSDTKLSGSNPNFLPVDRIGVECLSVIASFYSKVMKGLHLNQHTPCSVRNVRQKLRRSAPSHETLEGDVELNSEQQLEYSNLLEFHDS